MDDLIEFVLDLLIDGGMELISSEKISKRIRFPILIILSLFFLTITLGLVILGLLIIDSTILGSFILMLSGIVLFIFSIMKFKKIYKEKFF